MIKKIVLNIVLLFTTYMVPLYIFRHYEDDYRNIDLRQYTVFTALFVGSVLLIYLNNKYRKQVVKYKWLWVIFIIVGILGLSYSGFVLSLLFLFRDCCGF